MTGAAPHMIRVRGSRNLRDLGGYRAADARRVRHGLLYRGGHPGELCDVGQAEFAALGLGAIVDLRTTEEREHIPYPKSTLGSATYWSRDYALSRGDIVAMLRDPSTTPDAMRERMRVNYRKLLAEQHDGIAAVLGFLTEGRTPVLVNCTAGKDRTGVTIAVVLAALGVDREDIRRDYAYTEVVQDPGAALFDYAEDGPFAYMRRVPEDVMRAMMGSHPSNIDAMFEELEQCYGGVEVYLASVHGIDAAALAALKERMLGD